MKNFILLACFTVLFYACSNKESGEKLEDGVYYTCSMHPQVEADQPGLCPICHMDLVRAEKNNNADPAALQLNEEQIRLGNIRTDTIRHSAFDDKIVLTGTLNFNLQTMQSVSSRVMGRVEKLYYRNVGDYVPLGAPIAELYSEELNNAKQEYLLVWQKRKDFSAGSAVDFEQLLQSAKTKLLLWGMTEKQIQALQQEQKVWPVTTFYSTASGYITDLKVLEGEYVDMGGTIVNLADLSTLWAEAQVYSSRLSAVDPGSLATVQVPDLGNRTFSGKIDFANPQLNSATRINLVRVEIPNPAHSLKPGMPVYVSLHMPGTSNLSVPIDAVVRDGEHSSVWIQTAEKTYKSKIVQTGSESGNKVEIISGLNEGDIVVVSGSYLLYSEFIFRTGGSPMADHEKTEAL